MKRETVRILPGILQDFFFPSTMQLLADSSSVIKGDVLAHPTSDPRLMAHRTEAFAKVVLSLLPLQSSTVHTYIPSIHTCSVFVWTVHLLASR